MHCAGFPTQAIRWCFAVTGIPVYDLAHVGISRNPSANLPKNVLSALHRRPSFDLIRDRLDNVGEIGQSWCAPRV